MRILTKLLGFTVALASAAAIAADATSYNHSSPAATQSSVERDADNTGLNSRDKNAETLTPQDQPNTEADRKTLAAVRSAVVNDDSLSTSAHNVKILVVNGVVTLRGPVKNANEKTRVETIARSVAGVTKIDNQLDIAK